MCHVTPPTVGRWIEHGKLPSFTTAGGHRRVWAQDLLAFLRSLNIPIPPDMAAHDNPRILIVDDEARIRTLVGRVIARRYPHVEIHEASDGFEAGHKIASLRPALVILDLVLPGIDGLKVFDVVRSDETLKHVRVLAISGYETEKTREKCLKAGVDDFLAKPFSAADLEEKLSRLLPGGRSEQRLA